MKSSAVRNLLMVMIVAGLVGCQSGPRWAWWKRDTAPEDTSLVARTAAPALPSAQSAPQAVGTPGMEGAAPPSSANLAAAKAPAAMPASTLPAASAATITNAPIASYPAAAAGSGASVAMSPAASTAAPAAGMVANGTIPTIGATPPAGPYDPNAYQSLASTPTTTPAEITASSDGGGDRYAATERYSMPAAAVNVAPQTAANESAAAFSPEQYASVGDSYASQSAGDAASPSTPASVYQGAVTAGDAAAGVESMPPSVGDTAPATTDRYGLAASQSAPASTSTAAIAPESDASTPEATAASTAGANPTVQITSSAGQYRPGGTSSYVGNTTLGHIELASRPTVPQAATTTPPVAPAVDNGAQPAPLTPAAVPAPRSNRYGTY